MQRTPRKRDAATVRRLLEPQWEGREVRWVSHNKRECEDFSDWTIYKLEEARVNSPTVNANAVPFIVQAAEAVAWHGNMQPLRAMYPRLAPFLHQPKRGRGKYLRKNLDGYPLQEAKKEMKLIQKIWKEHFGRTNRHSTDGPSAAEILCKRWKLTDKENERLLKPSGKHKTLRRKSRAI